MNKREPAVLAPAFYLCADLEEPDRQLPLLWAALQERLSRTVQPPRVEVAAPLNFTSATELVQRLSILGPPHRLLHLAADLVSSGGERPRRMNSWDAACWADVDTHLGGGWLRLHVARDIGASEANPQHRQGDHWPPPESRRHVVTALRLPLDIGPPERIRLQILRPRPCFDKPGRPLFERYEVVPHHAAEERRAVILGSASVSPTPRGQVVVPDGALVVLPG